MRPLRIRFGLILLVLTLISTGCASQGAVPARVTVAPAATATFEPVQTVPVQPASLGGTPATAISPAPATDAPAGPSATPAPKPGRGTTGVRVAANAPLGAGTAVLDALKAAGIKAEQVVDQADLEVVSQATEGARPVYERVFTPVDRFSSVLDSITLDELRGVWTSGATTPNFTNIYVGQDDLPELTRLLGQPGGQVKPVAAGGVPDAVWADKMGLGILPFDQLTTKTRAIKLDGQSPVDNRFDAAKWPLTARAYLSSKTGEGKDVAAKVNVAPVTNRDASRMTVLAMTGVTAMARNSAVAIDRSGDSGFLAEQVGPELAAADITTTSNEISFFESCKADNSLNNMRLCSKPEYWKNLELSGVDALGLTGNHMNDFGYDNFNSTLDFYKEKNIPYYGGGRNEEEARKPLILEQNGNRLGFIGANSWGPESYWNGSGEQVTAWAGKDNPGAAHFDLKQMQADIAALKPQVDLVFAEVQHTEINAAGDYQTEPIPQQEADFRGIIDGGGDVVTGIMAHTPQAVETRNGKLILYGLGNLYFDQTWSWPTRTGLVARHTIYKGKLINTELLVTVIDKNFQLRWATPAERIQVLKSVFDVSRWDTGS